ncbi:histidine phosphatase family protein [Labrenzia sp. PHM005]|uniref:histidine phosphatase family protein n=1 Tax=Labrenzia sp. PHM005 TaxID=2590016 RepID=UPI00114073AC|nr:histidine phosphatase family protein [Labrenzia sp. PHM005]QDG74731.1 histidine phosphatase family protein [Labrenzia sp. PHM005]
MTWCVYLTHPEVIIDKDIPIPEWSLSDLGRERAAKAAVLPFAKDIKRVVSSGEVKAVETAEVFCEPFGLKPLALKALHENDRSATGFLPPEEFEKTADLFFAHPDTSIRGWERAIDAQMRIVTGIQAALRTIDDEAPVLFTGHGGVGTLLMCHLMGAPISRIHDQKRGGSWYRFDKTWLASQSAPDLAWTEL